MAELSENFRSSRKKAYLYRIQYANYQWKSKHCRIIHSRLLAGTVDKKDEERFFSRERSAPQLIFGVGHGTDAAFTSVRISTRQVAKQETCSLCAGLSYNFTNPLTIFFYFCCFCYREICWLVLQCPRRCYLLSTSVPLALWLWLCWWVPTLSESSTLLVARSPSYLKNGH